MVDGIKLKSKPGRQGPRYSEATMKKLPDIVAALRNKEQVNSLARQFGMSTKTLVAIRRDLERGYLEEVA